MKKYLLLLQIATGWHPSAINPEIPYAILIFFTLKGSYEYDDLNRLEIIRDHEDNIVQHYEYHYKNQ